MNNNEEYQRMLDKKSVQIENEMTILGVKEKLKLVLKKIEEDRSFDNNSQTINDLFILFRDFYNNSILLAAKSKPAMRRRIEGSVKQALSSQRSTKSITNKFKNNDALMYGYGALLSNQIAHLFDAYNNEILGSKLQFNLPREFYDAQNSQQVRELKQIAFDIKYICTERIIDNPNKDVYYGCDDNGLYTLGIYDDNNNSISIHVLEEELIKKIKNSTIERGDVRGTNPKTILLDDNEIDI